MGNDDLFKKRKELRQKRNENTRKQKSSKWLIVCEGTKTEPNYFKQAIDEINKTIDDKYKFKIDIKGLGKNTVSLVNSVDDVQKKLDVFNVLNVYYDKIFVVFDKDSFGDNNFDKAIKMCHRNNYIPIWSNQAFEYWFLLHFNYLDMKIDRKMYADKINEYFKKAGLNYHYQKNDKNLYLKLCKYGSLEKALKNAKKIHLNHINESPSVSESCTTVYEFFLRIDERLKELN